MANKKKIKILLVIIFLVYLIFLIKQIFFKLPLPAVIMAVRGQDLLGPSPVNLLPFKTILHYLQGLPQPNVAIKNLLGNILLFLPFGFLVPAIIGRINSRARLILAAIGFSLLLEISQLWLNLGSFDIDDLILNALGAAAGYLLFAWLVKKYLNGQKNSV